MGVLGDIGKELAIAALEGAQKGLKNYEVERHEKAIQQFTTVQQMENAARNGNIDAIQEMATMYFNRNDLENAANWALEGAEVNDAWCMHLIGAIMSQVGRYGDAAQWYSKNINVNNYSMSASNLAFLYMNVQEDPDMEADMASAEYYFKMAYNMDSLNPEAAFGLALCYLNSGNGNMNQIKALFQQAYRDGTGEIKHGAQELLNEIANNERNGAYNNNNNNNGCFITTAVCDSFNKADDCYELTAFRKFRDEWLINQADGRSLIDEYYRIAPAIVEKINKLTDAAQIYKNIWTNYLKPCLKLIESGENSACKAKYVEMVRYLQKRF